LVGARTAEEIDSTLPGCSVALSKSDVGWLNLEE
jgi:hypothetical protein